MSFARWFVFPITFMDTNDIDPALGRALDHHQAGSHDAAAQGCAPSRAAGFLVVA